MGIFFRSPLKLATHWGWYRLGSLVSWYFLPGSINLGIDFKVGCYLRSTVLLAPGDGSGLCCCLGSNLCSPQGCHFHSQLWDFLSVSQTQLFPSGDETGKYCS